VIGAEEREFKGQVAYFQDLLLFGSSNSDAG
jgi:hypothetical protein